MAPLPPAVDDVTILDFTATISTHLKILFVGDSIMQQFAQGFYSSVLLRHDDTGTTKDYVWGGKDARHTILRSFINGKYPELSGLHVCSSISAPVHGGGVVGYYRLLDLPSRDGEKEYVFCKNEKGWSRSDANQLLGYTFEIDGNGAAKPLVRANSTHDSPSTTWYHSQIPTNTNSTTGTVGEFDAIVIRPPGPGWMKLSEITRERIIESIELLHELFHIETVILTTLAFNNNVLTEKDWEDMLEVNQVIRDVAHSWDDGNSGVKFVLVQDFAAFTNEILWMNAEHLGYNVQAGNDTLPAIPANGDTEGAEFLLHRLNMKEWRFNPSIPMVCNTAPVCESRSSTFVLPNGTAIATANQLCTMNVTADKAQCFFNRFSRDGMHWCVETIGPRYSASVACLLGCVYNGDARQEYMTAALEAEQQQILERLKLCEADCNSRFMSIVPVDESWLDNETLVYSKL